MSQPIPFARYCQPTLGRGRLHRHTRPVENKEGHPRDGLPRSALLGRFGGTHRPRPTTTQHESFSSVGTFKPTPFTNQGRITLLEDGTPSPLLPKLIRDGSNSFISPLICVITGCVGMVSHDMWMKFLSNILGISTPFRALMRFSFIVIRKPYSPFIARSVSC
jgi:hypothetical protein